MTAIDAQGLEQARDYGASPDQGKRRGQQGFGDRQGMDVATQFPTDGQSQAAGRQILRIRRQQNVFGPGREDEMLSGRGCVLDRTKAAQTDLLLTPPTPVQINPAPSVCLHEKRGSHQGRQGDSRTVGC